MQTSSFQSMPCVSEDLARAQVVSMMTRLTNEKKTVRILNIDVRESNGMFIAIATYEVNDLTDLAKEEDDDKKGEGDSKTPNNNPEEEDRDAEGAVLHAGMHPPEIVPGAANLPNGELMHTQTEPAAFEPVTQTNLVEPTPDVALPPPTGPEALQPDAEFLADKIKDDFVEAETYNVDEHALVAERVAAATTGLDAEQMENLKAEIEHKLDEGIDPGIMPPDGGAKPTASPGTTT